MTDTWEIVNGLNENDPTDAFCDYDGDRVWNLHEFILDSDPNLSGSPVIYNAPPNITSEDLQELISIAANTEAIVIRFQAGFYDDVKVGTVPADGLDYSFMIQGGWDSTYCDYDPYLYKTVFRKIQTSSQFLSFSNLSTSGSEARLILDGFDLVGYRISARSRFNKTYYGFSNLSWTNPELTGWNSVSISGEDREADVFIINTTIVETRPFLLTSEYETKLRAQIINSTLSDFRQNGWTPSAIVPNASNKGFVDIKIKNSILWDDIPTYLSFRNDSDPANNIGDNRIDIDVEHSYMSPYEINDYGGIVNFNYTEDSETYFADPNFESSVFPHFQLAIDSDAREAGIQNNIPSSNNIPDIGPNQFAYSNIRLIENLKVDQPSCNEDDGSIKISMRPHHKNFEFSLNNKSNFSPIDSFPKLGPGDYVINIRTSDNCSHFQQKVTLNAVDFNPNYSINTINSNCGKSNGEIEIVTPQGWENYSYALDTAEFQTETTFDNLNAGDYSIWIKDDGDCVFILDSLKLDENQSIQLDTLLVQNTSCGNENGFIQLQITEANGEALISLNGNAAIEDLIYDDLPGGDYNIVVTDEEGCQDSIEVKINDSEGISFVDTIITQPTCGLDNGNIMLSANALIGTYNLESNGVPVELQNNDLPPGEYQFLISTDDGCSDEVIFTLSESEPVDIITLDTIGTTCNFENGSMLIKEVIGSPTEFSIDGQNYVEVDSFVNLAADTYNLYVQNENCADTMQFTIAASTQAELQIADFNDTSCGEMNGSAVLNTINGTGPYNYTLDTLTNQTGTFNSLAADSYIAFVEDLSGCIDDVNFNIGESLPVSLAYEVTNGTCGELGSIRLSVVNENDASEFSMNGQSYTEFEVFNELEEGQYTFYLRDNENCFDTVIVDVTNYAAPLVTTEVGLAYCEDAVGSIDIEASEGMGELKYSINDGPFTLEENYAELTAGQYLVAVIDEADCITTMNVSIESTPQIEIENIIPEQLICGESSSQIEFNNATGGTGELTYTVLNDQGDEFDLINGLQEGEYIMYIIDELGCEKTQFIEVKKADCQIFIPTIFNPQADNVENQVFKIHVQDQSNFLVEYFKVYDRWGNTVYDEEGFDPLTFTNWWDGSYEGNELMPGVYVYIIKIDGEEPKIMKGTITLAH